MDIIGKRYLFFGISLLVIIPGLIALLVWGLPLAIDFTGGSSLEVQFEPGKAPPPAQVVNLYNQLGIADPTVQSSEGDVLIIRSKQIDEPGKDKVVARASYAVALASLGILAYISFAFRGVPNAFRYGVAAIIATIHDILVVLGTAALLGHFLGWQVDLLFLTALLTVIGFSVHDDVVVFDRIRENSRIFRRVPYEKIINHSIVQTMDLSINTQFTVMLTLLALVLFGGVTVRHFVVTLLIGVFSGTYSSIFNAAPILVVLENHEWRYWFRPREKWPKSASNA